MKTEPEKDVEAMDDGCADTANVTSQLMRNPQVLAALQERLGSMVGTPSGYIQTLPKTVQRRIKALKNLQLQATHIEAEFYAEVHQLECKYHARYQPLYEQRARVLNGSHEPTDVECEFTADQDEDPPISDEMQNKASLTAEGGKQDGAADKSGTENNTAAHGMTESTKGVPEFWLTTFKNVDLVAEMIQDHDEPILKHLQDVRVVFADKDPMGFTLEFEFSQNDYFTNTVLTKEYFMKCTPDETDPFSFEGPEIIKCKGCNVDWKPDKNVTVKVVKKKQKHKSRGSTRVVQKTVQNDSFFNFFKPPAVPEDPDAEVDEDVQSVLTADFEIGHYIRERIVPRAVLYFTGEALDEDDDYDDDEEDDEEEEESDVESGAEEEDPDFDPKKVKNSKRNKSNPEECKQQ